MSSSSLNILRKYFYDPLDHLMGAGLTQATGAQRFYQDGRVATELEQDRQTTIFRHQAQPLAQRQRAGGVADTALLMTDLAQTVMQASTIDDTSRFALTVYGFHQRSNGFSPLVDFNGECPDEFTGHYPLGQGSRFYNPVLMRFNSPDTLSPFDEGGFNPYSYCRNDPVNFSDPTGRVPNPRWAQPFNSLLNPAAPDPLRFLITPRPTTLPRYPGKALAREAQADRRPTSSGAPSQPAAIDSNAQPPARSRKASLGLAENEVEFNYELPRTKTFKGEIKRTTSKRNKEKQAVMADAREYDARAARSPNEVKPVTTLELLKSYEVETQTIIRLEKELKRARVRKNHAITNIKAYNVRRRR